MQMCEGQSWCYTKGALQATLLPRNGSQALMPGTELVPSWLCHANVRSQWQLMIPICTAEPTSVPGVTYDIVDVWLAGDFNVYLASMS